MMTDEGNAFVHPLSDVSTSKIGPGTSIWQHLVALLGDALEPVLRFRLLFVFRRVRPVLHLTGLQAYRLWVVMPSRRKSIFCPLMEQGWLKAHNF